MFVDDRGVQQLITLLPCANGVCLDSREVLQILDGKLLFHADCLEDCEVILEKTRNPNGPLVHIIICPWLIPSFDNGPSSPTSIL